MNHVYNLVPINNAITKEKYTASKWFVGIGLLQENLAQGK
jgi:hypothetical protein